MFSSVTPLRSEPESAVAEGSENLTLQIVLLELLRFIGSGLLPILKWINYGSGKVHFDFSNFHFFGVIAFEFIFIPKNFIAKTNDFYPNYLRGAEHAPIFLVCQRHLIVPSGSFCILSLWSIEPCTNLYYKLIIFLTLCKLDGTDFSQIWIP